MTDKKMPIHDFSMYAIEGLTKPSEINLTAQMIGRIVRPLRYSMHLEYKEEALDPEDWALTEDMRVLLDFLKEAIRVAVASGLKDFRFTPGDGFIEMSPVDRISKVIELITGSDRFDGAEDDQLDSILFGDRFIRDEPPVTGVEKRELK